jgi:hypothetical protein
MKRSIVLLIILVASISAIRTRANEYSSRIQALAEQILATAGNLNDATHDPVFDSLEVEGMLTELKSLISEYETLMVFVQSPYPGEILLGTTPAGDDTWLDTLCDTRYGGLLKEIRIRRTGHRANYLRINDIEITYLTPQGPKKQTFNKNGRVKLYHGGVFKLALPKPMKVLRIRVGIHHESTGLQIYGIPYNEPVIIDPVEESSQPGEILLGTTPAGEDAWLETLCTIPCHRPIREIRLRRTGRKASYLRINDIEVTHLTWQGIQKDVFNRNGRVKLYCDDVYELSLPRPMRITRIRVLVHHESTGLDVYGVY